MADSANLHWVLIYKWENTRYYDIGLGQFVGLLMRKDSMIDMGPDYTGLDTIR